MNKEIILRIKGPQGQYRINAMTRDTYGQLLLQISKKINYPIKDIIIFRQDRKQLLIDQKYKIGDVPYFTDGAILIVQSRAPKKVVQQPQSKPSQLSNTTSASSKCNHPPGGKCLNCIGSNEQKTTPATSTTNKQVVTEKPKCNHGPFGKCLNCTTIDPKQKGRSLCQHGPNGKCVHCLDMEYMSDVAHVSFDNWLQDRKLKCKGVHPPQIKCNNCLPPSRQRYIVDKSCKNHQAYPKAMCNKCVPPNVVIQRQEYRHVDYVQFMNAGLIQNFVNSWLKAGAIEQRVAFLYGYYAQDPHYKGGIRVIVQALYEPKQRGSATGFQILQYEDDRQVNSVVTGLTLQKIGWIFTEINNDCVMSEKYLRMAAQFQEQYRVPHQSGYDISNFISVIIRPDPKNPNNVTPQVYMVSDQGQALQRADLFVQSQSRKKLKVRVKQKANDAYPSFIVGGKNVTQFQPQFLLVKIAHGAAKNNKFAIIKKCEFPTYLRERPTKKDLKQYMKKNKNIKQSWLKYGDFNFLIYLAHEIDPETAHSIAECVSQETNVQSYIDDLIEHKADL